MKKCLLGIILTLGILFFFPNLSTAGEVDVLVNKLVEKGILTPVEAEIVLDETKAEVAKQNAKGINESLPSWVQSLKLKGDLRLRDEYSVTTNAIAARNRGRIRLRLGVESNVNDKTKVGFGIATGSGDPRSTNQTMDNTFEKPGLRLDYAYAQYSPLAQLNVIGGKFNFPSYLWQPTDLLWDTDITPTGGALHWGDSVSDYFSYWINGGIFVVDENGAVKRSDPNIKYVQLGLKYEDTTKEEGGLFDVKVAPAFYYFDHVSDTDVDYSSGTNTAGTNLGIGFNDVGLSGEVGFNNLFGGLPFGIDERIAFFGDYVVNVNDSDVQEDLTGWAYGMKIGNKAVKEPGQWDLKYIKAILGKDVWLDALPDSDRLSGKTDVLSHEVIFNYALRKNITFGLDYYNSRRWSNSGSNSKLVEHVVQGDIVFKF